MKGVMDNAHCMRHACSHPTDEDCPHCKLERMQVDRTQRTLTDGSPVPADYSHTQDRGDGQQKGYIVLSAEERAKGFVRPVRQKYVHVGAGGSEVDPNDMARSGLKPPGCGALTHMGLALAETYARDPKFYNGTFCVGCGAHFPLDQFVWADTDEIVGT